MVSSTSRAASQISPSLRSFLTVASSSGANNTEQQPQQQVSGTNDLISRLEAFLPEIERANQSLPTDQDECASIVDLRQIDQPKPSDVDAADNKRLGLKAVSTTRTKGGQPSSPDKNKLPEQHKKGQDTDVGGPEGQLQEVDENGQSVEMDLFVDNTLGKLVACEEEARKQGEKEINSLVRELDSGSGSCTGAPAQNRL